MSEASAEPTAVLPPKGWDQRHLGHVCYASPVQEGGNQTVKVRVTDEKSSHKGKVFIVASVHGEMTLRKGLNVSFAIGTMDQEPGKPSVHVAVDVKLR